MSVKIKSTGNGLRDILSMVTSPSAKQVDVGIHGTEDSELIAYATKNEFGLDGLPVRSFIRQTFDKYADDLKTIGIELSSAVADGKLTLEQALSAWGDEFVGMINNEINEGTNFEENTEYTISRKGQGLHPLQDSGRLQQSIKGVVN
jgi:hypothetical protein